MFGIKIHTPSPALVVAALALLIALSGTAYAAATLARNSVGTAQLKNGAVTLRKIATSAQGALKARAWAHVDLNGTILKGHGISGSVAHTADSGVYDLTLTKPATNCAAIASENPNGGRIVGGVAQGYLGGGTALEVTTQYYGSGFNLADENFSVVVYC